MSQDLTPSKSNLSRLEQKLESQRNLATLSLGDSFIGDEGCNALVGFLRQSTATQTLELRGNNIGAEGAAILADALKFNTNVKSVILEWNNIGAIDRGVEALMRCVASNATLTHIDLKNNRIGPAAGGSIANALRENRSLQHLDLKWNDIGTAGGREIADALRGNSTIQFLELGGNKIPDDIVNEIDSYLERNRKEANPDKVYEEYVKTSPSRTRGRTSSTGRLNGSLGAVDAQRSLQTNGSWGERTFDRRPADPSRTLTDELQARYEAQVTAHTRTEQKVCELELMLEQEKQRTRDTRADMLKEIDGEKASRSALEETLLKEKENALKKELENSKYIQNLDLKLTNLHHEKSNLEMEYRRLRDQIDRDTAISEEKIVSLEERLSHFNRLNSKIEEQTKTQIEKAKFDHKQEMKDLQIEYGKRISKSEEMTDILRRGREDSELEVKDLEREKLKVQKDQEEELRTLEMRVRDEEQRKYDIKLKNLEERMRIVENSRGNLQRRNEELQAELQEEEKASGEKINMYEESINELATDKNGLDQELGTLVTNYEKLNQDFASKEELIERLEQDKQDLNKTLAVKKEAAKEQLDKLAFDHLEESKEWELNRENLEKKNVDLKKKLKITNNEAARIRQEYEHLRQTLQEGFSRMLASKVSEHLRFLESSAPGARQTGHWREHL